MIKGFTRRARPFEVLTPEELESVHRGALYVLEKTGMRVEHERMLRLCAQNGCQVDFEATRVRVPPALVEECLRRCPSHYLLRARNRDQDLMVGGNTVYFMQGMGMRTFDLETWEPRPATAREHREAMIVADALDNVHLADGVFFYMERERIPPVMIMLENLASGLRHSSKAEQFGYQRDCEIFAIQMADALGINLNPELDSASPLTIYGGAVEAAFRYVEAAIPIEPTVTGGMGSESPATLAGSLVLATAMILGWTTLVQLIKPGAPMSIQHGIAPVDMRTGLGRAATPQEALGTVLVNQILRRYRIPSCSGCGFTSNSREIDYQVGFEKGLGTLIDALSGGHLLIFQGGSGHELLFHPVLSILDNDIAGWVGRFIEGVTVTDDTLAIDLINQVGPIPGHYLGAAHTREWWRKEQYLPRTASYEPYQVWLESGKKDALALAKEHMDQILATHRPQPLTVEQEQAIERILKEARDYYRKRGEIPDEEWAVYMRTLEAGD